MPTTPPPLPENIARLAGPILLGYLFHWGLFGILSLQLYYYHTSFPNDKWTIKSLVYSTYCVEVLQTILMTRDCFNTYAVGFGNIDALDSTHLLWFTAPILIGLVSCPVQIYYAYRVYILSRSRILFGTICAMALLQGSSAIAEGVAGHRIGNFHDLARKSFVSCSLWLAGSAACDFTITCAMVYFLLSRDARLPETHATVIRLVHLVVETGLLTAIAALLELILFLRFPNDSFHTTVAFALAKLYTNSLLVLFNNRRQNGLMEPASQDTSRLSKFVAGRSAGSTSATLTVGGVQSQDRTAVEPDERQEIPLKNVTVRKSQRTSAEV